jgi:hypothetical protein
MLEIAHKAILQRASVDGYAPDEYDPAEDAEGYVISLLTALRHWCDAHDLDWPADLVRAQQLFEEDKREDEDGEDSPQKEQSTCADSATKRAADRIFTIVCESDWPEQPDAWPQDAILRALEELRRHQTLETLVDASASNDSSPDSKPLDWSSAPTRMLRNPCDAPKAEPCPSGRHALWRNDTMKITLETVRSILRESLGRESFVASFVKSVEETETCPTASISSDGVLRYNPAFATKYIACDEDLFCLVMHEIMHPMFGHFIYRSGNLENVAADMVINASISLLFQEASACGSLFRKIYQPHGMEGLLRPLSRMYDSRYGNLYDVFYGNRHREDQLTTGEVIQALKVLTASYDSTTLLLIGSHATGEVGDGKDAPGLSGLSAEDLCRIAENLKQAAQFPGNRRAGQGENLYDLFLEAIKTHLSIRKVLLQKFATKRKVDRFKQSIHQPKIGVSPIPLHPSKRDFVLLAAGIPPFHYHNHVQRVATKEHGLAVYLDVSGSVTEHLPEIVGVLSSLKAELTSIFLFSNKVVEIPFKALLAGQVQTTYGTDFDCIAQSILERDLDKAVVITDGYASLRVDSSERLKERHVSILTVLFGGKTDCDEFAPFGDVVQLADITE